MRIKLSLASLFFAVFAFIPATFAQTETTFQPVNSGLTRVADAGVYELQVKSQTNNLFVLTFDVVNRTGVLPRFMYAISLVDKNGVVVDQKTYDNDILSLGTQETLHKEVTYAAPLSLSGTYFLEVKIKTSDGLMLGFTRSPQVTLVSSGEGLSLDACFLSIKTIEGKYTLDQGVDIGRDETLVAHCTIKNTFTSQKSVTPIFETRYRTSFGKIINTNKSKPISIDPGKTIEFAADIPAAAEPQAYTAVLTFVNDKDTKVSPSISFHYVLRGESATIQNVILDKDYYSKGDTARVSLVWTGPADNFMDARVSPTSLREGTKLAVSIVASNGKKCIDDFTKTIDAQTTSSQKMEIPITADCLNPSVSVKIIDVSGKPLAQNTYTVNSKKLPPSVWQKDMMRTIALFFAILVALFGILWLFMKKKNSSALVKVFFGLALGVGLFASGGAAKADTFYAGFTLNVPAWAPNTPVHENLWFTFDVDRANRRYAPGEVVNLVASTGQTTCDNITGTKVDFKVRDMATGNTVIPTANLYDSLLVSAPLANEPAHKIWKTLKNSASFIAPSTPGRYMIWVYGSVLLHKKTRWVSGSFTSPYNPKTYGGGTCNTATDSCFGVPLSLVSAYIDITVAPRTDGKPTVGGPGSCDVGVLSSDSGAACGTTRTWCCASTDGGATNCASVQNQDCAPGGSFDGADCNNIWGVTCQAGYFPTSLNVDIYTTTGTFVGTTNANVYRDWLPAQCGGYGNHGFVLPTPAFLKDNLPHSIDVYAIGQGSGGNPRLPGTHTIQCAPDTAGVCGAWNQFYADSATSYGSGSYCAYGTPSATPAFPAKGMNVSWTCAGTGTGGNSPTCYASHNVNGNCGPAAANYDPSATTWAGNYCSSGTPSATPGFPNIGTSVSWTCLHQFLGTDSGTCTASRGDYTAPSAPTITADPSNTNYLNEPQAYILTATDTNSPAQSIRFRIQWNDGSPQEWTSYVVSGTPIKVYHTWVDTGPTAVGPGDQITFRVFSQNYTAQKFTSAFYTTNVLNYRPTDGVSGTAARNYQPGETAYTGTFCSTGTPVKTDGSDFSPVGTPNFPAIGSSTSWKCTGLYGGGYSSVATANHLNITCGTAVNLPKAIKPSTNLCLGGEAPTTAVTLDTSVTPNKWRWVCGLVNNCSTGKRKVFYIPF